MLLNRSKIGSDLKLRGSIDLKQVGKDVIKPAASQLQDIYRSA